MVQAPVERVELTTQSRGDAPMFFVSQKVQK